MANSLEGVLADIPGLAGYLAQKKYDEESSFGTMRKVATLSQVMDHLQQQKARQQAMEREAAFRAGQRPDMTPEQRIAHAAQYAGADAVLRTDTSHLDRQATLALAKAKNEQTVALARERLAETARANDSLISHRIALENNAEARTNLTRLRDQMRNHYNQKSLEIGGERLFYDTGMRVDTTTPQGAPSTSYVPQARPGSTLEQVAQIPMEDRQAYEMARSGVSASPNRQVTLEEMARMAQMPEYSPPPVPALPPAPRWPVQNNEQQWEQPFPIAPPYDPRDLRLSAAPAASQPSTPPAVAPQMPTFEGSPRQQAEARNRWLLQQSRANTTPAGDYTKTGEEYIKSLPLQDQSLVRKVIAYEIDPKTLSVLGGRRERVLAMASQADPNFDQKNYNMQYNAINRFATGVQGDTVRRLNVSIEHMDTARKLAMALQNKDLRAFNLAAITLARETGKPAPTNFEAAKDILANEVTRGIIGGQTALQDRQEMAAKIRAVNSPEQLTGALDTWTQLLGGQLVGLERQYIGTTGRTSEDFRSRYITPRALNAINASGVVLNTPAASGGVDRTNPLLR